MSAPRAVPRALLRMPAVPRVTARCASSQSRASSPRGRRREGDGPFQFDDMPKAGYLRLERQRQLLAYYRLMANEFPKLAEMSEPFTPPPASHIATYKFTHFQGEPHPASAKVVLTLDIGQLWASKTLSSPIALHKFLLIAGARWQPPSPAWVEQWNAARAEPAKLEALVQSGHLGTLKMASDTYPHESQNMKWCSDTLDAMIQAAQVRHPTTPHSQTAPTMEDVPLDVRPYIKSPGRGPRHARATKDDFPAEWL